MSLRSESSFLLLENQNVLISPNSDPVRLRDVRGLSITINPVSGVVGVGSTFTLQTSDFGINEQNPPTVWVTVASSSQSATTGLPLAYNLVDVNAKWLRLVYTNSGSSTAPVFTAWTTLRRSEGIG